MFDCLKSSTQSNIYMRKSLINFKLEGFSFRASKNSSTFSIFSFSLSTTTWGSFWHGRLFFDFVCPIATLFLSRSVTLKLCQSIESSLLNNNFIKKEEGLIVGLVKNLVTWQWKKSPQPWSNTQFSLWTRLLIRHFPGLKEKK